MGIFLAYILKSAICLAAYYLLYKLLLSRDTFYRFNRASIIVLLLGSMLIPLLKLDSLWNEQDAAGTVVAELSEMQMAQVVADEAISWEVRLVALMLILYLVGVAFFALRTLVSYVSLWRLFRRCEQHPMPVDLAGTDACLLVSKEEVAPFSWMNYIVISEKDMKEGIRPILLHELGHIGNRHTLDLLFTEICLIVQWFNPAIWLMRRELQAIHEYEADEHVLNAGVNAKEYQLLLIKKAVGSRLQSITNSLHQSSIKNRITMMQSKKSSSWGMAKSLIALPVAAICVAVFATPKAQALTTEVCGCKVSDLFSTEQVSAQETAVSETTDDSAKWSQAYRQANEEEGEVFVLCEEMPKFPGGEEAMMRYVAENVKYPKEAFEAGIQGRVAVQFIVEKDGSISFPDDPIVKSVSPELDAEAMRVIQTMPAWTPGKQRGQNIRCKFVIPITFRLQ